MAHNTPPDDPRWRLAAQEQRADGWYQRWEIGHDTEVHVLEVDQVNPRARTSTPPEDARRSVVPR